MHAFLLKTRMKYIDSAGWVRMHGVCTNLLDLVGVLSVLMSLVLQPLD